MTVCSDLLSELPVANEQNSRQHVTSKSNQHWNLGKTTIKSRPVEFIALSSIESNQKEEYTNIPNKLALLGCAASTTSLSLPFPLPTLPKGESE
jgi:hypothetical protein